jgi:hypothetical protein
MTNTLLTSTKSLPPAITPDARYAFDEGAFSNSFLDDVNVRACWIAAHRAELPLSVFAAPLLFCALGSSLDSDDRARDEFALEGESKVREAGRMAERANRRGNEVAMAGRETMNAGKLS